MLLHPKHKPELIGLTFIVAEENLASFREDRAEVLIIEGQKQKLLSEDNAKPQEILHNLKKKTPCVIKAIRSHLSTHTGHLHRWICSISCGKWSEPDHPPPYRSGWRRVITVWYTEACTHLYSTCFLSDVTIVVETWKDIIFLDDTCLQWSVSSERAALGTWGCLWYTRLGVGSTLEDKVADMFDFFTNTGAYMYACCTVYSSPAAKLFYYFSGKRSIQELILQSQCLLHSVISIGELGLTFSLTL